MCSAALRNDEEDTRGLIPFLALLVLLQLLFVLGVTPVRVFCKIFSIG